MADMWNSKLTRENISDFYNETVVMVYSSVMEITKETTRAEQAIVKSYLDIYSRRASVNGEDVIFVFGDILLKNANDIMEQFPLPENVTFQPRSLDEYTGNFMLEKILNKIDSKSFKMVEFMNASEGTKSKSPSQLKKMNELFPITPLLIFEIIVVSLIIWGVSYLAITLPYKKSPLISEQKIYKEVSLEKQYAEAMDFFPLVNIVSSTEPGVNPVEPAEPAESGEPAEPAESGEPGEPAEGTTLDPDDNPQTEPEVSATSG